MLISWAIRSRAAAVGVGFLLNSTSKVTNWSCVALCLFWFFCCCVSVLLRGGLLAAEEADVAGVVDIDAVGEGVDVSDISRLKSSICMLVAFPLASSVFLTCRVRHSSMLLEVGLVRRVDFVVQGRS